LLTAKYCLSYTSGLSKVITETSKKQILIYAAAIVLVKNQVCKLKQFIIECYLYSICKTFPRHQPQPYFPNTTSVVD